MKKKKEPKQSKVQVIPRELEAGGTHPTYEMLDAILIAHHDHLAEAKIVLAWNHSWKADVDNRLVLGKCKKAADLERELHGFDFVILLNHPVWNMAEFDTKMKRALIDHELCHAQVCRDEDDTIKKDAKGRLCCRIRKHDLEEFRDIVSRHGAWKDDIREFVKTTLHSSRERLNNELFQAGVLSEDEVKNLNRIEAAGDAQLIA